MDRISGSADLYASTPVPVVGEAKRADDDRVERALTAHLDGRRKADNFSKRARSGETAEGVAARARIALERIAEFVDDCCEAARAVHDLPDDERDTALLMPIDDALDYTVRHLRFHRARGQ